MALVHFATRSLNWVRLNMFEGSRGCETAKNSPKASQPSYKHVKHAAKKAPARPQAAQDSQRRPLNDPKGRQGTPKPPLKRPAPPQITSETLNLAPRRSLRPTPKTSKGGRIRFGGPTTARAEATRRGKGGVNVSLRTGLRSFVSYYSDPLHLVPQMAGGFHSDYIMWI